MGGTFFTYLSSSQLDSEVLISIGRRDVLLRELGL